MKRFLLLSIHTGFLFGQEVVDLKSDNIMVWILLIILSLYRKEIIIEYNMLKSTPPIKKYFATSLSLFLKKINVLICTVPLTHQTKGLLNKSFFKKLNNQTYLINVSRGEVHVEKDIIEAICLDTKLLPIIFVIS